MLRQMPWLVQQLGRQPKGPTDDGTVRIEAALTKMVSDIRVANLGLTASSTQATRFPPPHPRGLWRSILTRVSTGHHAALYGVREGLRKPSYVTQNDAPRGSFRGSDGWRCAPENGRPSENGNFGNPAENLA